MKTPEKLVLNACMDLLAAERVWAIRLNTVAIRNAKGRPIYSHTGGAGVADIMATPLKTECVPPLFIRKTVQVLWIECKSDSGKQRPEQSDFQRAVEAVGHHYLLARSSDDVLNWLKEHQ